MHKSIRRGQAGHVIKLDQLIGDERNSNRSTPRGRKLLKHTLQNFGTGRSVLVDKHLRLIAGNKTFHSAIAASVKEVVIVQSDGTRLIAVQRTNLDLKTDSHARALAIADNLSGQVSLSWHGAQLVQDETDYDIDLESIGFNRKELSRLHPRFDSPPKAVDVPETFQVLVECSDEAEQKRIFERMREEGRKCRVLTL